MKMALTGSIGILFFIAVLAQACGPLPTATPPPEQGEILLDFEDVVSGTPVETQYRSKGVTFSRGAIVEMDPDAHSPGQVLRAASTGLEFHPVPLVLEFSVAQERIQMYAGVTNQQSQPATLKAFDANGNLVAQDGPKTIPPGSVSTPFEVSDPGVTIVKAELLAGVAEFEVIDDLRFSSPLSPGPIAAAPTVQILEPSSGASLDSVDVRIRGTVDGGNLPLSGDVTFSYLGPPPSATRVLVKPVTLSGTGNSRTFDVTYRSLVGRDLPLGPIEITVAVTNTSGNRGEARRSVHNMPSGIGARIVDIGEGTLGNFSYGLRKTNCAIAVFEHSAIAQSAGGTFLVHGSVFEKWASRLIVLGLPGPLMTSEEPGQLGCPLEEQETVADRLAQRFEYGRVIAAPDGTAAYIPRLFVEAMEAMGGILEVGFPSTDPSRDIRPNYQTWLFQRYMPATDAAGIATLELRGDPTTLYVERMVSRSFNAATVIDRFSCSKEAMTCRFDVATPEPLRDMGRYCNYEAYDVEAVKEAILGFAGLPTNPVPAQWEPIVGENKQTALRGTVVASHLTDGDNPLTHQHEMNCSTTAIAEWLATEEEPPTCAADWDLDVIPFAAWNGVLGEGRDSVRVEYEMWYFTQKLWQIQFFHPKKGNQIFVSGRWVVDCGHDYKTEIHPPGVLAWMMDGSEAGTTKTRADVWVTGWFTGGDVEFTIPAPPRPRPDALLQYTQVTYEGTPRGVTVDAVAHANELLIRISSEPKAVKVTGQEEMIWTAPNTGYEGYFLGRYYVYWR